MVFRANARTDERSLWIIDKQQRLGKTKARVSAYHLTEHLYELYQTRADVYERMGNWTQAISDLTRSAQYTKKLFYWRGLPVGILNPHQFHSREFRQYGPSSNVSGKGACFEPVSEDGD